jgi:CelD/BcsL family acetyltransferase involved in cellulose biosynthesis
MSGELICAPFEGDDAAWNAVANKSGTLFHQAAWLMAQAAAHRLELRRFGFFRDGRLIGLVPLFVRSIGPLRVAASPFVLEDSPYCGIAIDVLEASYALDALLRTCRKSRIHFIRLVQSETIASSAIAKARCVERQTHRLALTVSKEELWKGLEGRCRTAVRKAEKSGVEVTLEEGSDWITPFYAMLRDLYVAQGLGTPNPVQFYYEIWSEYANLGLLAVMARLDGKLIAGALVGIDAARAYYLSGASDPAFNPLAPNNLIQWRIIEALHARGVPAYDFVGSDIPRLAKFKASFGGTLSFHSVFEASSYEWLWFVRERYPAVKMWQRRMKDYFSTRTSLEVSIRPPEPDEGQ